MISKIDLLKYSRQTVLSQFGIEAQQKLANSKVLIIGLGGLGSPAALYLASSGIGELIIADFDVVEVSNLSRQILHTAKDVGEKKTVSAFNTLKKINPQIKITKIEHVLSFDEVVETIQKVDIVLDCTDNFETRYEINQASVDKKAKLVTAAAIQFSGQLSSFDFSQRENACYQCLYPDKAYEDSTTCAENGILSPIVGIMGVLQALETIKLITGVGENLNSKLLIFDGLNMDFRTLNIRKNESCTVCNN